MSECKCPEGDFQPCHGEIRQLELQIEEMKIKLQDQESITADYLQVCRQRDDALRLYDVVRKALGAVSREGILNPLNATIATYDEHVKKVYSIANEALLSTLSKKRVVSSPNESRICAKCGGDHLDALTCQERNGVYER